MPPTHDDGDDALIALAREAQTRAYAPYSRFRVGAAVRSGAATFSGANVENASYGLSICAERNAVVAAVLARQVPLDEVAVVSDASPPASPCGMCRQTLLEFARDPATFRVVAVNHGGERKEWRLAELIPDGFTGEELRR
jgi:cytidine deaminase